MKRGDHCEYEVEKNKWIHIEWSEYPFHDIHQNPDDERRKKINDKCPASDEIRNFVGKPVAKAQLLLHLDVDILGGKRCHKIVRRPKPFAHLADHGDCDRGTSRDKLDKVIAHHFQNPAVAHRCRFCRPRQTINERKFAEKLPLAQQRNPNIFLFEFCRYRNLYRSLFDDVHRRTAFSFPKKNLMFLQITGMPECT